MRERGVVAGVAGRALRRLVLPALLPAVAASGAEPVSYEIGFPEPEQRWMEVLVVFPELPPAPLDVRMSRSSPGRYALHEFVKNVYEVEVSRGDGTPLAAERPDRHGWRVGGHDGTVRFRYRIYGDRVDGTYLGIDTTHAHINAPAALVWARGLEARPVRLRFRPPAGAGWRAATQLRPTQDPLVFTAPNLAYLMDSPVELSAFAEARFALPASAEPGAPARTFRIALHHQGTEADLEQMAQGAEAVAREQRAIFGELPDFDGVGYTFLADYLPWASGDGMEHRNSTVLTSSKSLAGPDERRDLLGTVSHELFHAWNVERIRPASLEPFDFEDANVSGLLWLAEGFTSYYGVLTLHRAGLADLPHTLASFVGWLDPVIRSPARQLRSAVEMSRLAPFVDAATSVDRTNWPNTYISYYTWGAAIALGLDLELRARSEGTQSLDDLMRVLWLRHGRPGGAAPGLVARPYTLEDVEVVLAGLTDAAFARDFLDRFVRGCEVPEYASLLARAGFLLRPEHPDRAWLGDLPLDFAGETARIAGPVPGGSPARRAGLAEDDTLVTLDGEAVGSGAALARVLRRHAPGDAVAVRFLRRGRLEESSAVLGADPELELLPAEDAGTVPDEAVRRFRDAWLGSRAGGGER